MPYVILYKGTEYNDEIYSIGGGYDNPAKVYRELYDSVDKVRAEVRALVKKDFGKTKGTYGEYGFRLGDFSYDGDEMGWDLLQQITGEESERNWGAHFYADLIEQAEEAGIDWLPYIPQLYEIVEVA